MGTCGIFEKVDAEEPVTLLSCGKAESSITTQTSDSLPAKELSGSVRKKRRIPFELNPIFSYMRTFTQDPKLCLTKSIHKEGHKHIYWLDRMELPMYNTYENSSNSATSKSLLSAEEEARGKSASFKGQCKINGERMTF